MAFSKGGLLVGLASAAALVTKPPPFGDPLNLQRRRPPATAAAAAAATPLAAMLPLLGGAAAARADILSQLNLGPGLDPATFQPVCSASDSFYRFGQQVVVGVVGPENVKEYAPLIAGGLLRVRLELCVVESFFYEAILPFIKENGLSWVLPLHETVETFLAGVIFAVATNFILLGSTKIITVIVTYADFFAGFPFRVVGGLGWRNLEDKAIAMNNADAVERGVVEKERPWWRGPKPREAPPIEDIVKANSGSAAEKAQLAVWGGLLGVGVASKTVREVAEAADTFAGRYLLITTVAYVGFKFIHFKVFDPFP